MLEFSRAYLVALARVFQRHEHAPGIRRTLSAGKSHHLIHRWIFQYDPYILLHLVTHRRKGNLLLSMNVASQSTGILLWEQSLGCDDEQVNSYVRRKNSHRHGERL